MKDLSKHTRLCEAKERKCALCGRHFSGAVEFQQHMDIKHPKIKCELCGIHFIHQSLLKVHLTTHHSKKQKNE